MNNVIEKLSKFLQLEIKRDFDNRSVIGGFEKLCSTWKNEAIIQNLPFESVATICDILSKYDSYTKDVRQTSISQILDLISSFPNSTANHQSLTNQTDNKSGEFESHSDKSLWNTMIEKSDDSYDVEKSLSKSILSVQGIGKNRAEALARLNIFTIKDLLYYFPKKHEDYSNVKQIIELEHGDKVSIIGSVINIYTRPLKNKKQQITELIIDDGTGKIRITFFNQPFIEKSIRKDTKIIASGKVEMYLGRFVLNNPEWAEIEHGTLSPNRLFPYYPLTKSITQKWLRGIISRQIDLWVPQIRDFFSEEFRIRANLLDLQSALLNIHFPEDLESKNKAEERFAFQDTFFLHLAMLTQKKVWQSSKAKKINFDQKFLDQLIKSLPYNLTNAQQKCVNELLQDLETGLPMSRLIQGDVGSGKTIVAAIIIAGIIKNGYQTVVLAPTGILADQLFMNIRSFLLSNQIISTNEICFLSGDTSEKEREIIKSGLLSGIIKVVVGTHAILEDPVQFKNLEFVVIDEQHRFGVMQRKKIRAKGKSSHLLVMSATPIPRSLALTIYGDLDLSIIDEMPPGRKEVRTRIINPSNRIEVYRFIQDQINTGNQAFIVYPLVEIEDNETEESNAAVNEYYRLKTEIFPRAKLGLLHGRMKIEDKEKMMEDFRNNKYQILITTTVIEVGVDIPNATIMLIEGANKFGLSQLHQLRGRVGRGNHQSFCFLIPENEDAIENERLKAMAATNDGFKLAEIDLQQRGPGDFIGTRQSGFKEIRFSTIMNGKLIDKARKLAKEVLENDPNLINVESHFYKLLINEYWQRMMGVKY